MTDNIFDNAKLISWLEAKPAGKDYVFVSPSDCVLAQYFHENGYPDASVGDSYVRFYKGKGEVNFPDSWKYVSRGWPPRRPEDDDDTSDARRQTFGEALRRAKFVFE